MPKKVLIICYSFPPCAVVGSLRSAKFVKYLGEFGWHSEVLTAWRGGQKEYESDKKVKVHSTIRIDLARILSVLVTVGYTGLEYFGKLCRIFKSKKASEKTDLNKKNSCSGGLGIATCINQWLLLPDGRVLWMFLTLPKALWYARRCDVIYSSLFPYSAHVLGLLIKKITGKPWVADYRDEWSLNSTWKPPTRFHRWLGEKLDAACVKKADRVIYVTQAGSEGFFSHFGGCREKFVTIHNGYDEADILPFSNTAPPSNRFVMTSLGSLYGDRDVRPFLRAVAELMKEGLIDDKNICIKLIGAENKLLLSEIKYLGLENIVSIYPRIPQQEAFRELSESHLAVLIGSNMEKVAMTTKIYEYAGMGKPILALVPEGPVYDFVKKYGGWCVKPDDAEQIKQKLKHILRVYKEGNLTVNINSEFAKKYTRKILTEQLAGCLDECLMKQ